MRQLTIKVRNRSNPEVLNLGLMTARRYFLPLLAAALPGWALALTLGLLLGLLFGGNKALLWTAAVVWWLKPLYERPVLLRLSRLLFREATAWKIEQKSAFADGWLAELTVLRPLRLSAPIRHALHLLEGVHGSAWRERKRFFANSSDGGAMLFLLLAEMVLCFGVLLLLPLEINARTFFSGRIWHDPLLSSLLAGTFILLELLATVFYTACGFMRYLNRRIINEGWAIALDLQTLAARLGVWLLAGCLALSVLTPTPAFAEASDAAADKALLLEWTQSRNGPFRYERRKADNPPPDVEALLPSVKGAERTGEISKAILLLAGGAVLLFFLLSVWRARGQGGGKRTRAVQDTPEAQLLHFSAPVAANSRDALHYLEQGNFVAALAVLYGRLVAEPERHALPAFFPGESESEYLQRAENLADTARRNFLRALFALWQRTVYAHRTPTREEVRALITDYGRLWQE